MWSLLLGVLLGQTVSVGLWQSQLVNDVEQIMGLAGLNKIPTPPQLSPGLVAYRQQWHSKHPKIAPFLGHWQQHWEPFSPQYDLYIFPSGVPDQVCLIATQIPYQDPFEPPVVTPPPSFSVLKIDHNGGKNQAWQLNRGLIHNYQSESEPFQFFGILVGPTYDAMRTYAAAGRPQLPQDLPANIQAEFRTNQCQSE